MLQCNVNAPRVGPRPLGVHLGLASSMWLGGHGGVAMARDRFATLTRGIEAYWAHPYRRAIPERPVLWQAGTTRLLDFAPAGAPPAARTALLVPSLVNRAYILDLAPGRSLTAYLAARGIRPLVVDWGAPGEEERGFDLTGYVTHRLMPAFDAAARLAGTRLDLIGYCMGGLLALPVALARRDRCTSLTMLATPWDFHAEDPGWSRVLAALEPAFGDVVEREGVLPVDLLQACFAVTQPTSVSKNMPRSRRSIPPATTPWRSSRSRIGSTTGFRSPVRWQSNACSAGTATTRRRAAPGGSPEKASIRPPWRYRHWPLSRRATRSCRQDRRALLPRQFPVRAPSARALDMLVWSPDATANDSAGSRSRTGCSQLHNNYCAMHKIDL